jgi:hypothetical protein
LASALLERVELLLQRLAPLALLEQVALGLRVAQQPLARTSRQTAAAAAEAE